MSNINRVKIDRQIKKFKNGEKNCLRTAIYIYYWQIFLMKSIEKIKPEN